MAKKKKKEVKEEPKKDEQAKIEDDEDDKSLSNDKYLIKYIKDCKKVALDATVRRRAIQRELWMLYQSKEDWSKKKDWQSKVFIPKIFMAIERAAALVKRAILQTSKLFTMEMQDEVVAPIKAELRELKEKLDAEPEKTETKEAIEKQQKDLNIVKEQLADDEKRFKKELKKSNFTTAYGEMIKSALLLGMGDLKRVWNGEKKKLRYENIDVLNLYIDPDYMPFEDENPDFLIEYKEMSLARLRATARAANKATENGDVFDMDEIDKIKADYKKSEDDEKKRQRRGLSQHSVISKKVGILEFWGNVVSKDGKTMKENQLMMLVNEKHLIRRQDNPFADGKYPHDLTVPIVYPHRGTGGVSLVESEVRLQYTLNNILNMIVDNLNFIVNKVVQYHPSSLVRPNDIHSIYPGKMIPTSTPGDALREVKMSGLGQDVFKAFEIISSEMQESTAVTEFLTGMPGKKAKTLGEVEIKTAESQGLFDVIAQELEINSIKPILKGSYDLLVQFTNFSGEYEFNVGGLSLLLLKKEQAQTLLNALGLALKSPFLTQHTKLEELWKRLLSIWDISDVYTEPEDEPVPTGQPALPGAVAPGQPGQMIPTERAGIMPPAQKAEIDARAAEDARRAVANMPPEEIMQS